jgi:hypothetical protein
MSFAITWLNDVLHAAFVTRSTSVEIARDSDDLIGKINVGEGNQSLIHVHPIGLSRLHIADLYAYLQQRTGCMKQIDIEIDRGYGRFTVTIDGWHLHINVFVHGTHPHKIMDLAIEYQSVQSVPPPAPANETDAIQ